MPSLANSERTIGDCVHVYLYKNVNRCICGRCDVAVARGPWLWAVGCMLVARWSAERIPVDRRTVKAGDWRHTNKLTRSPLFTFLEL